MAWNIKNATYSGVSYASEESQYTYGIFFKPDGTKMYILDDQDLTSGNSVYQYSLSSPWDITTADYDNKSYALPDSAGSGVATAIFFKPDGTRLFSAQYSSNVAYLFQFDLSTPWDVSSASANGSKSLTATFSSEKSVGGLFFKPDGIRVIFGGPTTGKVQHFDLATAWDITSDWSNAASSNTNDQAHDPVEVFLNSDGTKLFVLSSLGDLYQYTLSTPWAVNGATYDNISLHITQESEPEGMAFKSDGTQCFIIGPNNNTVYQYLIQGFVPQITIL